MCTIHDLISSVSLLHIHAFKGIHKPCHVYPVVLQTDVDYSGVLVPSVLTLDVNLTRSCVNISIIDDNIVEGTESFKVKFSETENNLIEFFGLNTTDVHIVDNESKFISNK